MKSIPSYSAIVFSSEISDELIDKIENWIRKGIKVYLFTFDVLEDYETRKNWQSWRNKHFFYWYEIRYQPQYDGKEVYFFDGNITDPELYEYLCRQSQNQGLYSFNREQYEIEHSPLDKHLSVIAGAGTGKTTVMINRLMFLKHVAPDQYHFSKIAMITFTNEAAVVIRRRVYQRLRDYYEVTYDKKYLEWMNEVVELHISTIHAFAKRFFELEGRELGFSNNIHIRNFHEQRRRIVEKWIDQFAQSFPEIYQSFEMIPHYELVRAILSVIEKINQQSLNDQLIDSLEFGEDHKRFHELLRYVILNSMKELEQYKQEQDEWEVNDLIRNLPHLQGLRNEEPKWVLHLIMVDEFQDTDSVQVQFLLWLQRRLQCALFVVGDVKQSIYRFRGADYTAFEQLHSGLPPTDLKEVTLVNNYRTVKKLLDQFHPYFRSWGEEIKGFPYETKDRLVAMRSDEDSNEGVETGFIVKNFGSDQELKEVLTKLEGTDTAILVRSNQEVHDMIAACEKLGFLCEGKVSGNFYRTLPVRELYLLIRFLIFPQSPAIRFALHRSSYGANTLSNQAVINAFDPSRHYIMALLQEQEDSSYWNEILRLRDTMPPFALLEKIITERKPQKVYAERLWLRLSRERIGENLDTLKEQCNRSLIQYENRLQYLLFLLKSHFSDTVASLYGLERFLRIKIATDREQEDPDMPELVDKYIKPFQCMTVHKAKGLEFDFVLLPITTDRFIVEDRPHIFLNLKEQIPRIAYQLWLSNERITNTVFQQLKREERLELVAEETRLLYVAMTRAKKGLFVHRPTRGFGEYPKSWSELLGRKGERVFV